MDEWVLRRNLRPVILNLVSSSINYSITILTSCEYLFHQKVEPHLDRQSVYISIPHLLCGLELINLVDLVYQWQKSWIMSSFLRSIVLKLITVDINTIGKFRPCSVFGADLQKTKTQIFWVCYYHLQFQLESKQLEFSKWLNENLREDKLECVYYVGQF